MTTFYRRYRLAAKTMPSIIARYRQDKVRYLGIKVLDPITFLFSDTISAHYDRQSNHKIIAKERPATTKLTTAVEALEPDAAPSKALGDEEGDVLVVALGVLVSPASAAFEEAEA